MIIYVRIESPLQYSVILLHTIQPNVTLPTICDKACGVLVGIIHHRLYTLWIFLDPLSSKLLGSGTLRSVITYIFMLPRGCLTISQGSCIQLHRLWYLVSRALFAHGLKFQSPQQYFIVLQEKL
jgi:hypothetical protein